MNIKYACIAIVSLTGCMTPYGPNGFFGGYSNTTLGEGRYLVSFDGNGYTSSSAVRQGAFRRAAELCHGNGFTVLDSNGNTDTTAGASWNNQGGSAWMVNRHNFSIIIECKE